MMKSDFTQPRVSQSPQMGSPVASPEADPLLANLALPLRAVFYPLGFAVEVCTNDRAVLEAAQQSWGGLRPRQISATIQLRIGVSVTAAVDCPPAPIVRAQRHLITFVADSDNQATGDLQHGFAFINVSRVTVQHQLYFRYHFLEALALVLLHGMHAPALHAGCVSLHGRGILLCGSSGAGKSTLAYACARAGFTYVSDDASYLIRNSDHPRVVGHSHKFRFRPSSRQLFPELDGRDLTPRLEGKPSIEVRTDELSGVITAQEARISFILLLRRDPAVRTELEPIPTASALEELYEHLYPVAEIRHQQIAVLQQLLPIPAFVFHYSNLDTATRCLEALCANPGQAT